MDNLLLELWVDGELRQRGGVDLMLYRPDTILSELRSFVPFADNDIVMTGTPSGVGAVKAGERFEGRVFNGDEELLRVDWLAV